MQRLSALAAVLVLSTLGLTGCGGSDEQGSTTPKVIDVTFDGDDVTPNGDRIKVDVNQPVVLEVTADKAGEIHVHSNPEHEFAYDAGTTEIKFAIDRPGVVAVESHALDKQIVSLEVE